MSTIIARLTINNTLEAYDPKMSTLSCRITRLMILSNERSTLKAKGKWSPSVISGIHYQHGSFIVTPTYLMFLVTH